jgi:uncharacterized membrane protein YdjX (TVP38/TMEM64 family)
MQEKIPGDGSLSSKIKISILFVFIVSVFASPFYLDISRTFNPENLKDVLQSVGALAPVVYIFMMVLAVIISPVPSLPLDVAAGAFFGPLLGTVYSVIGALSGAVISFMIARYLGREFIEKFLGGHINFCTECSDRLLTRIVFLSRLLPIVSFDVISYGAGLTKMSVRKFTFATFFGMIPLTFIYNYFGSVLIFGKGITITLGIIMIILFFVIPRWLEKKDLLKNIQHR